MPETTEGSITINASPEDILGVITDFETYPKWAQGVQKAVVKKSDSKGRPREVYMEAGAMGFVAKYTLEYSYKTKNAGVSWASKDAEGAIRSVKGEYVLDDAGEENTKVTYRTTIELAVGVPRILKRQGEKIIIANALNGLKERVERR